MATSLSKPVWRTVQTDRGLLNVALSPQGVLVRRYGSRTTYGPVPFTAIEDLGAKITAAANGHVAPRPRRARGGAR